MSEQPKQPRKQPRSKAKKITLNPEKSWKDIVDSVEYKKEVPVTVLQRIVVKLVDGTDLTINIKELIDDGNDPDEIEALLNAKFHDLDEYIEIVDFFIDIDSVVNTVQPETDKVLKNL